MGSEYEQRFDLGDGLGVVAEVNPVHAQGLGGRHDFGDVSTKTISSGATPNRIQVSS